GMATVRRGERGGVCQDGVSQRIRTCRHPLTVGITSGPLPLLLDADLDLILPRSEGVHGRPCVRLPVLHYEAVALQRQRCVRAALAARAPDAHHPLTAGYAR